MNAVEYCLLNGLKVAGPEHPAILSVGEQLSYGALVARVAQFAAGLRRAGVRVGDRVGMLMLDTPDIVALHQAVMAIGGIAVAMSNRASPDELRQIFTVVRPVIVVADAEFADAANKAAADAATDTMLLRRDRELAAWKSEVAGTLEVLPREPSDPAYWVMTSGTTGAPKAVEHCHGNVGISDRFYVETFGSNSSDRFFGTSRFHFAYAIGIMFSVLRLGATNILMERWATAPSVAALVEAFAPTVLLSVPSVFHLLLDAGVASTPAFRAIRYTFSAGERLPPQIGAAWERESGQPILDGLGCSELVFVVTANIPVLRRLGSSGRAAPCVEVRIVDTDGVQINKPDRVGRIEVRMPSVCLGYRHAGMAPGDPPDRPADVFKPDGWFATGDEYSLDADGFLFHRGRSGDMLRVSGIWVSPAEIEDALGGLDGIAESAAVQGENEIGLAEIVLFVVPAIDRNPAAALEAARTRLEQALPSYKRPRRFEAIAALPRTATGKVQRHKLRQQLRRHPA
jgi:3-hydroxybenzoate/4-hydroxybenzoate---CoA ligase